MALSNQASLLVILVGGVLASTFIVSYSVAFTQEQTAYPQFYLSDTISYPVSSCIGSLGLSLTSLFLTVIAFIRYLSVDANVRFFHLRLLPSLSLPLSPTTSSSSACVSSCSLQSLLSNEDARLIEQVLCACVRLNGRGFWYCILCACGALGVGCFQYSNAAAPHSLSAFVTFLFGVLFCYAMWRNDCYLATLDSIEQKYNELPKSTTISSVEGVMCNPSSLAHSHLSLSSLSSLSSSSTSTTVTAATVSVILIEPISPSLSRDKQSISNSSIDNSNNNNNHNEGKEEEKVMHSVSSSCSSASSSSFSFSAVAGAISTSSSLSSFLPYVRARKHVQNPFAFCCFSCCCRHSVLTVRMVFVVTGFVLGAGMLAAGLNTDTGKAISCASEIAFVFLLVVFLTTYYDEWKEFRWNMKLVPIHAEADIAQSIVPVSCAASASSLSSCCSSSSSMSLSCSSQASSLTSVPSPDLSTSQQEISSADSAVSSSESSANSSSSSAKPSSSSRARSDGKRESESSTATADIEMTSTSTSASSSALAPSSTPDSSSSLEQSPAVDRSDDNPSDPSLSSSSSSSASSESRSDDRS